MDLTIVLTAAAAVLAIIGTNVSLIAWLRSDMRSFETEVRGWRADIDKEMKDFHGRLCSLESRWHGDNSQPKTDP